MKMKNINILLATIISLFIFASCEDEIGPYVGVYTAPSFLEPAGEQSFVLNEENQDDLLTTFKWSAADFGFPSATTYVLQMDKAGNNFASAMDVVLTTETEAELSVGEMNTKMLTLGLAHSVSTDVEARIYATINEQIDTLYSETITMSITPYEVVIVYPNLYVPGSYQAASGYTADWSPDVAPELFSIKADNRYEGYVNIGIEGAMFKFTEEPNWNVNYGDDGNDGTLESAGADIAAPAAGYYKMNVNLNNMTYSITKTDWGLIGDATPDGWDADQNMTYDADAKVWTVTLDLTVGEMKFRANDAWDLDYGDNDANLTLEQGGDNIAISQAGNYTVTLDLSGAIYTYSVVKN